MNRLTTRYGAQVGPANGVAVRYMALSPDTNPWIDKAIKRLAAYEDTGLTPDEITALRAENERYKADIEAGRLVRILCRCERCEYWDKEYIAPNPDFHFCKYDQTFTPSWHYCGHAYNRAALEGGQANDADWNCPKS